MLTSALLIIVGFILLIKGADFLVYGASSVAKKFHIPEIIIGLTIVSIGTSLPELFVSLASELNGSSDMVIGNVIGSNLNNLLLILGLSTTIRPVKFQRETRLIENPICIIITAIFIMFCNTSGEISKSEAFILIIVFIFFIIYTIIMSKKGEQFDKEDTTIKEDTTTDAQTEIQHFSIVKSLLAIFLGAIALKIGGDLTVKNATSIARMINISEKIISLTILAIGTSLPELVTGITATIRGSSDIAIGNIIGSNIFNILLIIGISGLISPITYNFTYNTQIGVLLFATILLSLFSVIPPKNEMSRLNGVLYLIIYIIYTVFLFIT